ncbi:MAG: adenosine kinase, partial [Planctomycetaceae bacterium]|nr:adenosine kinase [Planctomycetaceae bacterium]
EFWLEDMRRIGVGTDVDPTDEPTGTCVVLITEDAQRTMLTSLGASSTLGPEDIDEEMIRQSEWVYVEGYLFTGDSTKAAAYRAIELAKKNNVKVAFTVSDPFLISLFRDEFLELLHGPVDLLFCNLDEARALTEKTDPIDCAQAIHQHAPHVAMTLGADGSLLMNEGSAIPIEGVEVKA